MRIGDCILHQIESDLGINIRYSKGQADILVENCWHFSTDGNAVDTLFWNDGDFRDGMNRMALLNGLFNVVVLAFALMDNHVHFILYGDRSECDKYIHEFVRRTSIHISRYHGERHKLKGIPISCQKIDTQFYLKTAVCYVLRNPTVAGLPVSPFDYPWSSGPLMFRKEGYWCSPGWYDSASQDLQDMNGVQGKAFFKSHEQWNSEWKVVDDMVFPGEYVAYDMAERLFRTHKAFLYFLGMNKESDIEALEGRISSLSIPDQEMRQHKNELCKELFGESSVRRLDMSQRILLARTMKKRYQSSPKQIARVCGLVYDEVKDLI